MKFALVFVCLLVALAAAHDAQPTVTKELVNKINSQRLTWEAGMNKFADLTIGETKALLGTAIYNEEPTYEEVLQTRLSLANVADDLPEAFDARTVWPQCIHAIRNQLRCGSCWAFAASEAVSDRFCIQSNSTVDLIFSPQYLVSCDTTNMGCNGGQMDAVWEWMTEDGIVTDQCLPYTSGNGQSGSCPSTCTDGSSFKMYKTKNPRHVTGWVSERETNIMKELQANGPIEVAFEVYQDFMSYTGGVYQHKTGEMLGGHAVKLIGWGKSADGTKFWRIANSWGADWGEEGTFRILRGSNECGVESQCWAGDAAL